MVTHLSTNPVRLNPLHLQQCSLRLFRICSVAAVVLFSLLSFDRSVVYSQCFPLTLASYCEYRISSIKLLLISCSYHRSTSAHQLTILSGTEFSHNNQNEEELQHLRIIPRCSLSSWKSSASIISTWKQKHNNNNQHNNLNNKNAVVFLLPETQGIKNTCSRTTSFDWLLFLLCWSNVSN